MMDPVLPALLPRRAEPIQAAAPLARRRLGETAGRQPASHRALAAGPSDGASRVASASPAATPRPLARAQSADHADADGLRPDAWIVLVRPLGCPVFALAVHQEQP